MGAPLRSMPPKSPSLAITRPCVGSSTSISLLVARDPEVVVLVNVPPRAKPEMSVAFASTTRPEGRRWSTTSSGRPSRQWWGAGVPLAKRAGWMRIVAQSRNAGLNPRRRPVPAARRAGSGRRACRSKPMRSGPSVLPHLHLRQYPTGSRAARPGGQGLARERTQSGRSSRSSSSSGRPSGRWNGAGVPSSKRAGRELTSGPRAGRSCRPSSWCSCWNRRRCGLQSPQRKVGIRCHLGDPPRRSFRGMTPTGRAAAVLLDTG